jgi:hypothetical protein
LTTNAKGIENGLRGEEDGISFFGTGEKKDVYFYKIFFKYFRGNT